MHSQLEEYRSGFQTLKEEATALVDDVDEGTLRRPPAPETWSVAQIFDHVNTAGWLLLNALEGAIQTGHEKGPHGEPPFDYGFVSRWFVRSMRPSSNWTFTAPSVFEPDAPETLYPGEAVEEFFALQDQFATCVVDAEGLDLRRIRVSSPAVPLLRISLGAWFEASIAHERRHLEQARDVLRALDAAESTP
jgi:hypothetical protein